jgi:hypothetical protein
MAQAFTFAIWYRGLSIDGASMHSSLPKKANAISLNKVANI